MTRIRSGAFVMIPPAEQSKKNRGFTLVELLIAMLVGGIVMAAVMTSFQSQHNTYLAQDQVVEMQQNARVAMDLLVRDIRSAGFDPNNLGAGITVAGAQTLSFTREDDLPAAGLETISYSLYDAFAAAVPPSNDGLVDDLARQVTTAAGTSAGRQVAAENISRLEFRYLDAASAPTAVLADIRSIQVSIMVQAAQPDTKSPPASRPYTTPSGVVWNSTAGFRSVYLTTTVQCRNLGL
jgi:type IV pilus assembly protein PilW